MSLGERFIRACRNLGATGDLDRLAEQVLAAWCEPHRRYHGRDHLQACLTALDQHAGLAARPAEVELALFFHDAIYEPGAADCEDRSARWAESALSSAGIAAEVTVRIGAMVRATALGAIARTPDEELLVDLDRSILAAEPSAFDEYERGVRAEYPGISDETFDRGRAVVLTALLSAPLFRRPELRARWEEPARDNLRRSLARLGHPPGDGPTATGKP